MPHPKKLMYSRVVLGTTLSSMLLSPVAAQTKLADQPSLSTLSVPGNMALALSVEFPTAISVAHKGSTYSSDSNYLGYFDPNKCYDYVYQYNATTKVDSSYFSPASMATSRTCSGKWSGNYMNWATMQTIDPFRWALTGGYRSTDTATETILEKGWASAQGGIGNFPDRAISPAANVPKATPVNWATFNTRTYGLGNVMRFTASGNLANTATAYNPKDTLNPATVYQLMVRVKVCDTALGVDNLEKNCTLYPAGNYKPTGLIQQYANQIRYSAFGYLNDGDLKRDGAVLRAAQKFVGPTRPVPGGSPVANADPEWNATDGTLFVNPNAGDATATEGETGAKVGNSGVMNYLNKFGQFNKSYKTYDPVSELHYAAVRYFKNLGNVTAWSSMGSASQATKEAWVDGFPVITKWNDPMIYSCQKNFILGIGDTNSHADRNLPGATGSSEPTKPAEVDEVDFNAVTATNKVGTLQNSNASLGTQQNIANNNAGALMAGTAYFANTKDIRDDLPGRQSVQTYWLDVLETGFKNQNTNPFYLATKFGGFTVPEGFDPETRTTALPESWWRTNTDTVGSNVPRPDNYFTADRPDLMVSGLTKSFASIAAKLGGFSSALGMASNVLAANGTDSFATSYDTKAWTGDLRAYSTSFDAEGNTISSENWKFSAKLETQAAGGKWATHRFIATYDLSAKKGVPFTKAGVPAAQLKQLDTSYQAGDDSENYLNYLRGDRTHERSSLAANSIKAYRDRNVLVGDIVGAKAVVVGPPNGTYAEDSNPGYAAFKALHKDRKLMVYAGTNHGMLHAVEGSPTGTGGREVFAYVPGALFAGPTGTPTVNGLQAVGKPDFTHYNFVDAMPHTADVDFGRTGGTKSTTDWRTILVGGLGKGGKSIYALDITNPGSITSDTAAAAKVLWEFNDAGALGYTFGQPSIVKTKKHGWVVIIGSGYNNQNGSPTDDYKGFFYILNAKTGALLEKIGTGVGSAAEPAGLAHVQPFLVDRKDGTADAVYAGDLLGNLWRLDVSSATDSPPAPTKLAELTGALGATLPVTSRPLVVVQPGSNRRYVTVGTGRLLDPSDISSAQAQRYFAIIDGGNGKFGLSGDKPSELPFPYRIGNMKELTDLTKEIKLDLKTQVGWYIDLGKSTGGTGWRVTSDSTSFYGTVLFTAMAPTVADACKPEGSSRVYAINLGTGSTMLKSNNAFYSDPETGVLLPPIVIKIPGRPATAYVPPPEPKPTPKLDLKPPQGLVLRPLNWREVPLTN